MQGRGESKNMRIQNYCSTLLKEDQTGFNFIEKKKKKVKYIVKTETALESREREESAPPCLVPAPAFQGDIIGGVGFVWSCMTQDYRAA